MSNNFQSGKTDQEPVNLVVSHTVKPGVEKEYEKLIHQSVKVARRYSGHEGTAVIKDDNRRYHIIYHFSDHGKLNQWLDSETRQQLIKKIRQLVEADAVKARKITGFEAWFKVPHNSHQQSPPRWKMLLATLLGAYPVVVLFQLLIAPRTENWPLLARSAVLPVVMLSTMTYVVMPRVTKLLEGWLYKDSD